MNEIYLVICTITRSRNTQQKRRRVTYKKKEEEELSTNTKLAN